MNKIIQQIKDNKNRNFLWLFIYKTLLFLYPVYSFSLRLIPSEIYLKLRYKNKTGKKLNLKNPKTLNEKIQWKKIYDRKPIYTFCTDKYTVRDYVKNKIGKEYLIPLLFHTDNPDKIPFYKLFLPFIIKPNHGSGWNIIIKSKKEINKIKIIKKCKKWLNSTIYFISREWQCKDIKPQIIIEKLLLNKEGQIPEDYKFHCFHGKVEAIQVDFDRFVDHKRSFFDTNWKLLPFIWAPRENNKSQYIIKRDIPRPKKLNDMIKIAKKLSEDFSYVRVDLYYIHDRIYFWELTFSHGGGFESFFPEKYDRIFGDKLKLNLLSSHH